MTESALKEVYLITRPPFYDHPVSYFICRKHASNASSCLHGTLGGDDNGFFICKRKLDRVFIAVNQGGGVT